MTIARYLKQEMCKKRIALWGGEKIQMCFTKWVKYFIRGGEILEILTQEIQPRKEEKYPLA
jgi:hypothetical protein